MIFYRKGKSRGKQRRPRRKFYSVSYRSNGCPHLSWINLRNRIELSIHRCLVILFRCSPASLPPPLPLFSTRGRRMKGRTNGGGFRSIDTATSKRWSVGKCRTTSYLFLFLFFRSLCKRDSSRRLKKEKVNHERNSSITEEEADR